MFRTLLSISIAVGFATPVVIAWEPSWMHAGSQPDAKKAADVAPGRAKIIGEIRSDLGDVVDKLNKNDPGAQTRARQNRIVKNIDKLLDDDQPPSANSKNSNSPPPSSKQNPQPKPQAALPENNSKPIPKPNAQPKQSSAEPKLASKEPNAEPKHPAAMSEHWPPPLPRRYHQDLDALSRGRFMPRYEDLLREYYRALAESRNRDD